MAITEQDHTYLMDLAAVLKALREARDEAAQVVQQLREQTQACRDLDARAAHTLTQAVQRATPTLQQAQARPARRGPARRAGTPPGAQRRPPRTAGQARAALAVLSLDDRPIDTTAVEVSHDLSSGLTGLSRRV